jgi:hypothetical protein
MDAWSRSCVDAKEIKKQARQGSPIRPKDCVTDPIPGAKGKSPFFLDEYFSWMSLKVRMFSDFAKGAARWAHMISRIGHEKNHPYWEEAGTA